MTLTKSLDLYIDRYAIPPLKSLGPSICLFAF
jgi:hypothetical protein